jgi:hypothetical protein
MGHELGYDNENIDDNYFDISLIMILCEVMVTSIWDELYEPEVNDYGT